ncbi:MAG: hypothetical protein FWE40_02705 [Oscillospiraceae bacterium]|nr:hypothetical protein [Oscillospiraceae bacterium]
MGAAYTQAGIPVAGTRVGTPADMQAAGTAALATTESMVWDKRAAKKVDKKAGANANS